MNLASFVERHAVLRPDKPAIEFRDRTLTYAELNLAARRAAGLLRAKGAGAGSVVGLSMTESPAHVAAVVGAARIGAGILPMDWRATASEAARLAARFDPLLVLTDRLQLRLEDRPVLAAEEIDRAEPDPLPPAVLSDATLYYSVSSGTTGAPKAMVVTHEVQYSRFVNIATEFPLLHEDRFLASLPLAFAAGQIFLCAALYAGATVVLIPPMFDAAELVKIVNERNVSVVHSSPNVIRSLLTFAATQPGMLMPKLRLFISGTGGLSPEERGELRTRIAPNLMASYGCAGVGPIAVIGRETEALAPKSVGVPFSSLQVEIVDDEGAAVQPGEGGWVRLRGPAVISEVVGGDPKGDEGVRDGWYYPGDIGRFDESGFLYLLGRSADLIKHGGKTVYSPEVEQVLMSHPAVREAAVVGAPGGDMGEEVVGFVKLIDPVEPRELTLHCRRHLVPYKIPSRILVVEEFPRNTSGKVLKSELKRML